MSTLALEVDARMAEGAAVADTQEIPTLDSIRTMPPVAGYRRFQEIERRVGRDKLMEHWDLAPTRYRGVKGRLAAKASAGRRGTSDKPKRTARGRRQGRADVPPAPAPADGGAARVPDAAVMSLKPTDRLRMMAKTMRGWADELEACADRVDPVVDFAAELREMARTR